MHPKPGFLILCFMLASCTSLSDDDCPQGSWSSIGADDAARGQPITLLSDHRKSCRRVGVIPDEEQYLKGYRHELVRFCSEASGFSYGRNGYAYQQTCPMQSEKRFLAGFERGHHLHEIETATAETHAKLVAIEFKLENPDGANVAQLRNEAKALAQKAKNLDRKRNMILLEADQFLKRTNPDL